MVQMSRNNLATNSGKFSRNGHSASCVWLPPPEIAVLVLLPKVVVPPPGPNYGHSVTILG